MTNRRRASALVILLHGVGSNGENMMALADAWRGALPDAAFAAPDAPLAYDYGEGRQWFNIAGVTAENRAQRIADARPGFDRVLQKTTEEHGFEDQLDRVILVGFSQGSMMLLDAVATGRFPVAAGVAFAGRLAAEPSAGRATDTKLLLLHGAADNVVPPPELDHASTALKAAGFDVERRLFEGVGHTIVPEAAKLAEEFIMASLAEEPVA